ncbi:dual specificity protein phosphatase 3-like [Argiope bruennichi]|uniref:protein-serine/threonine phosphatase n=1 Tax=Argiope bruennichi TaxID=94029 RepID=A0A8T0E1Q0_ARGBR|nr:dual specificity protein phosphatase 3-like [Argiope bruennichi]XP_055941906.1 dual specificity protein phosphatase 3-like [Argiope bruennichi]KAF8764642.1 Dual specificity protein phosphatase 3 like protein [Argiope bruennichi]
MNIPPKEPLCTVEELRNICLFPSGEQEFPTDDCDEVFPGIFLGNAASAKNLNQLLKNNIGYVLNAAHGSDEYLNMIEPLSEKDYSAAGIRFLGIPAIDSMGYPLHQHFNETIAFMREALQSGKGVLVHCKQGISRSAAVVIAFLMIELGMPLQEATRVVRQRREILPNEGFLLQLCNLYEQMHAKVL